MGVAYSVFLSRQRLYLSQFILKSFNAIQIIIDFLFFALSINEKE